MIAVRCSGEIVCECCGMENALGLMASLQCLIIQTSFYLSFHQMFMYSPFLFEKIYFTCILHHNCKTD